jgi:hypothetical protein
MVGTRATPDERVVSGKTMTDQEELEHLVVVVMGKKDKEHPILQSCRYHGIETADKLISYTCVESKQHTKDDDVTADLAAGHVGAVFMVQKFAGAIVHNNPGVIVNWANLTNLDYKTYVHSTFDSAGDKAKAAASAIPTGASNYTPSMRVATPLQDFEKGIRRDKAAYLALKDNKAWDSWRRSTIATARTHKCEEVFDPLYVATTDDNKALFRQKLLFIYSVFDEKLQTDMGKNLVRTYESNSDAQQVYAELAAHATTSTRADIESQHILTYLTTARFGSGDSGWKGTGHSFILHWQNKVREYEEMVPPENFFSEGIKLTMLQNAVSGVPELHGVKVQAQYDKVRG